MQNAPGTIYDESKRKLCLGSTLRYHLRWFIAVVFALKTESMLETHVFYEGSFFENDCRENT